LTDTCSFEYKEHSLPFLESERTLKRPPWVADAHCPDPITHNPRIHTLFSSHVQDLARTVLLFLTEG